MGIDFKTKEKKTKKATIANGIFGLVETEQMKRLYQNYENKQDFYNDYLGINNAIFLSENKNGNVVTSYTLIILDISKDEFWYGMPLNFADGGHTGKYTIPIIDTRSLPLGIFNNFADFIEKFKSDTEVNNGIKHWIERF